MQAIFSATHLSDLLILTWLYIALTVAYQRNCKRLVWAGLFILCLAGGLFSILLQERLFPNYLLYMLIFVLWGCVYGAAALKGSLQWKAAMVSVYCCIVFHLGKCAALVTPWLPFGIQQNGIIGFLSFQLFVILTALFLAFQAVTTERKVPAVSWLSLMCVSLIGIVFAYYQTTHDPGPTYRFNAALYSLGMVMIAWVATCLCAQLIMNHEQDLIRLSLEEGSRGEAAMARHASQAEESLRSYRQEMNHHLATLSALLENGQTEEARALIEQIAAAPSPVEEGVRSGNALVDAMLNQKAAYCRERHIAFSTDVALSDQLPLSDTELISLLGNLLNNAVEAAVQCPQPFIRVRMYPAGDDLCVEVINSADPFRLCANPELKTTKEDPQLHGIGLRVVRAIAARHNGMAVFDTKESGQFSARVLL